MTDETRKAIECIRKGNPIECSDKAYRSEIRDAIIRFASDCADRNDTIRMRIALAEVNRLDSQYVHGPSPESPDKTHLAAT
jgi:hypothetical protein